VSRSALALAAAALAAALLAPASAQAGLGWHDAGAGVPATVTLNDVARDGDTAIAVGKDTVSGEAVIYRLTGGAWQRDALLAAGAPIKGTLTRVAVANGRAWAVGTEPDNVTPLLAYLPPPENPPVTTPPTPPTPPAWRRVDAPLGDQTATPAKPAMGTPLSVVLSDTAGYAGDVNGRIWALGAGTVVVDPAFITAPAAPVNGIGLGDGGKGVAVGGAGTDARIFNLNSNATIAGPAPMVPGSEPLKAVALRGLDALAVDSGGYWQPGADQTWSRVTAGLGPDAFALSGVALGQAIQVLSGKVGSDGYVWTRRTSSDSWERKKIAAAGINAVAAKDNQDIWAVGDKGVVMHFNRVADPVVVTCDPSPCGSGSGSGSGSGTGSGSGSGSGSDTPTTETRSNPQTTTVPPAEPGDPTIDVVEPDRRPAARGPRNRRRPQRRLLDRVAVTREARRLVVSFRLTAPARVAISATRGRATVARAVARAMRAGRRRVTLPFSGAAPTELRIVVRPLPAKRAGRARGGNAGA
jgi:hypothetical protein